MLFIPSNYVTFKLTTYPITLFLFCPQALPVFHQKPGSKVWDVVKKVTSS
jgi:hypothetical protein